MRGSLCGDCIWRRMNKSSLKFVFENLSKIFMRSLGFPPSILFSQCLSPKLLRSGTGYYPSKNMANLTSLVVSPQYKDVLSPAATQDTLNWDKSNWGNIGFWFSSLSCQLSLPPFHRVWHSFQQERCRTALGF